MCRSVRVLVLFAVLLVGLIVHELLEVAGVLHVDLEHPAVALGFVVDERGVALDVLVVGGDLAGDGRVDVSGRLHGLDAADAVALQEGGAHLGDVEVHDVAELALGEVGDADLGLLQITRARLDI